MRYNTVIMNPSSSQTPPDEKKEKILVIEGDGAFGERIAGALWAGGYIAVLVKNGLEGFDAILDNMPHLILMDISLPGVDGYEILSKKHAEPMLSKIPVFLLSSQSVPIDMRRIPQGAVAEFLLSFHTDVTDIVQKVDRHFGRADVTARKAHLTTASGETSAKTIIWVEDDKLIGTILGKKLSTSGFNLIHAKNGEEAMDALKSTIPDAIVLDLLLPGMSGFDILQKIYGDTRLKKVPVIILSNLNKPSDMERAKLLGARKFLVKAATSLDQIVVEVREICK